MTNEELILERAELKQTIRELQDDQAAKYRRIDCLRIAQKHIEDQGEGYLVDLADRLSRFVETGVTGAQAKQVAPLMP